MKNNIEEINDCILAPLSRAEISMHIRRSILNTVLGARDEILSFSTLPPFHKSEDWISSVVYRNSKSLFLTYTFFFFLKESPSESTNDRAVQCAVFTAYLNRFY